MLYSTDAGCGGLWWVGIARNAVFFHSFVASKARIVASKAREVSFQKRELQRTGCSRCRQNLHDALVRPIWRSKSLKIDGPGTFFDVQTAFRVAGAGILTHCKIRGRCRSS